MNQIHAATQEKVDALHSKSTVLGTLNFIVPQDEKPYFNSSHINGGTPEMFFETEYHRMPIHDMRESAENLDIDREGFELMRHTTHVSDLYDDAALESVYKPEIKTLLKDRFGASKVVVFDVTRRSDGGKGAINPDGLRGPARLVHADYTVKSGPHRTKDILGELTAEGSSRHRSDFSKPSWRNLPRGPFAAATLVFCAGYESGRSTLAEGLG